VDVELKNRRIHGGVKFEKTRWVPRAEQERLLAAVIISACRQLEVGVVISQRVINRHLQEQLVKAGLIPLERVSVRHVDAVARLTGAQPLGTWHQEPESNPAASERGGAYDGRAEACVREWSKSLGVCGAINTIHLGGQRFTLIRPPSPEALARGCVVVEKEVAEKDAPSGVATLVLCAPTEPEMRELDAVVQAATMVGFIFSNIKLYIYNSLWRLKGLFPHLLCW
jgi:hypothetical protein